MDMTEEERDNNTAIIEHQLESNHAGHMVLRQAAQDFFKGCHDATSASARERLIKAFEMHFEIDAPTAHGMFYKLKSCQPGTYISDTRTGHLKKFFIHAQMQESDQFYDFVFTL